MVDSTGTSASAAGQVVDYNEPSKLCVLASGTPGHSCFYFDYLAQAGPTGGPARSGPFAAIILIWALRALADGPDVIEPAAASAK